MGGSPDFSATAASMLLSEGNWFAHADLTSGAGQFQGYIPLVDGSGNAVTRDDGYYANKSVSVYSFGDKGGEVSTRIALYPILPLKHLRAAHPLTELVSTSGLLRTANTDVIATAMNAAASANISVLATDASDYTVVGDTNGVKIAGKLVMSGTPQALSTAGAINLTTYATQISTPGATAYTLASAGAVEGQRKWIGMVADSGDATITVSDGIDFSTIVMTDIGQNFEVIFQSSKWWLTSNNGCTVS